VTTPRDAGLLLAIHLAAEVRGRAAAGGEVNGRTVEYPCGHPYSPDKIARRRRRRRQRMQDGEQPVLQEPDRCRLDPVRRSACPSRASNTFPDRLTR